MNNILLQLEKLSKRNDEFEEKLEGISSNEIYGLLNSLENRIKLDISKDVKRNEIPLNDQAKFTLRNLAESDIVSESHGLDYNLELVERKPIINQNTYPLLFKLVCLPGEKDKGVIKENHGMGYHIHYVVIHKKRECRTNIVMTFKIFNKNNEERHRLYWENHGSGLVRHPDRFKNRRRESLYDTSGSFLTKIPLKEFRAPKNSAKIMWPL